MGKGVSVSEPMSRGYDSGYPCTRCRTKEASHYCRKCSIYFCRLCLRTSCNHEKLDRYTVKQWSKGHHPFMIKCNDHVGNPLDMYCISYDTVCCNTCVTLNHKNCGSKLIKTTQAAKDILKSHEKTQFHQELESLQTQFDELYAGQSKAKRDLGQSQTNLLKQIDDYRTKINALLVKMEHQTKSELSSVKQTIDINIQKDMDKCNGARTTLATVKKELLKYKCDEPNYFIILKLCKRLNKVDHKIMLQSLNSHVTQSIKIKFHPQIEPVLKQVRGICQLSSYGPFLSTISEIVPGHSNRTDQNAKLNSRYKIEQKNSFNAKSEKDEQEGCDISGMCIAPTGNLVITDNMNKTIKQVDKSFKVIDSLTLSSEPGVCCVGEAELVVAIWGGTLQFVTINSNMSLTHSFKCSHICSGVACYKGQLAVTSGSYGRKLNLYRLQCTKDKHSDPQHTQTISDMLSLPQHVAYSPDGTRLYVADGEKGLVTLDNKGRQLAHFSPPELQSALYVCVDSVGNVFVCGGSSKNVLQVNSTGEYKMVTVVGENDEIKSPRAICFDSTFSILYVAEQIKSDIKMFYLKQ